MVTPFAPYRDGIAAYALQELRRLREAGERVDVCSPQPSAARWHLPLGGPSGAARLAVKARSYERVILHFAPEMVLGRCGSMTERVAVWLSLGTLAAVRPLDVRIHELDYAALAANPVECRAARAALDRASRITVHTDAERGELRGVLGLAQEVEVLDHGRDFRPAVARSKAEARRELGLPADGVRLVSIGFLQKHKGFDLAIDALDRLHHGPDDAAIHLDVVGSARIDHPEVNAYVALLRGRCAEVATATLHERFVSDVEFDLWIQAADAVVLPYREIWSSSVLERAAMFDTPVVASNLPQLMDQAPPGTRFFGDVDELSAVMDEIRGSVGSARPDVAITTLDRSTGWKVDPFQPDRGSIQTQITARAAGAAEPSVEPSRLGAWPEAVGADERAQAVDIVAGIGALPRPRPQSARPGVGTVKQVVDRLTSWRVDPVADHLASLHRATIEAVDQLERRMTAAETRSVPPGGRRPRSATTGSVPGVVTGPADPPEPPSPIETRAERAPREAAGAWSATTESEPRA
jgi:glycosyltransferase involved in cell wall biosynthesis